MCSKFFFDNERIIPQSSNEEVILTFFRIRHDIKSSGQADIKSILLRNISSVEIHYRSYVISLIIGIVFCLLALGMTNASNNDNIS